MYDLLAAAANAAPSLGGPAEIWGHIVNDFSNITSPSAFSAFLQVLMIDIVLAGDNAIVVGALAAGLPTEQRKKVIFIYLAANLVLTLVFLFGMEGATIAVYNWLCLALGLATGYWVIFVTVASEQFGTNLRSTVTNTAPNFVRGAVIPISLSFMALRGPLGDVGAVLVVGAVCLGLSLWATLYVRETFGDDMDFLPVSADRVDFRHAFHTAQLRQDNPVVQRTKFHGAPGAALRRCCSGFGRQDVHVDFAETRRNGA